MLQTVVNHDDLGEATPGRDAFVSAYRLMLLARVLDDKFASLYRMGKISGGVFLGRGQEALSVAAGLALRRGDVFAPLIRDAAGRLAFGEPMLDSVRTFLGSRLGPMRGRDGNVHRGNPRDGHLAMISHLGTMLSVANGVLFAHRLKGVTGTVGVVSMGDGATSTGSFHEGINQAAVEKLPVVVVIANNQYAYSTPNQRQFACEDLVSRAEGYGVRGHKLDGTDLEACLTVVGEAVRAARAGEGPQMVVAKLLRLCGHGEHDDGGYVNPDLKAAPHGGDCLKLAEARLLTEGWADAPEIAAWRAEAVQKVEETVARVQREPAPDPSEEQWCALSARHLMAGCFPEDRRA
jgi:pyruvate dehydrogenase E1 component alpha subunit/2-oxoisovalerate dehydrogenase E1 component alpha subunit